MAPHDPSKPSLVPEVVLKKKANLDRLSLARTDRLKASGNRKNFAAPSKTGVIKIRKAEKYIVSSRGKVNNDRRYNRVMKKGLQSKAKKAGSTKDKTVNVATGDDVDLDMLDEETSAATSTKTVTVATNSLLSPVVFCVRIRPDDASTPASVKRTLSSFRLRNIHEGVFIKFDKAVQARLNACEHYVVYGIPSFTVVQELINRRGYVKVAGEEEQNERLPLSDNIIVEKVLGDLGVICVEDVVEELLTPTANFGKVNNFLWPFRLSAENSRFETQKLDIKTGRKGEYGDVGDEIADFVRRML